MAAPVAAILGMNRNFVPDLPRLYPHVDARGWYGDNQKLIEESAFRNSSLQAGYLLIAARMLGLDSNPMSGFDAEKLDADFFAGTSVSVNFITTLGHGDRSTAYPRGPRLSFEEACRLA
ncbi:malonic semialdehyde reductase [Steroidobacter sp.]|uniref:malonic semialdehyde reductase n=1 Tax=Steroidobacter sp. TaxID=1978227 RepID=UPI002ED920EA